MSQGIITTSTGAYAQRTVATYSEIMQPTEQQARYQKTVQTHNAVSVPGTTGLSVSAWIDTDGFDQVAFTFVNAGAFASSGDVQWSNDGSNQHGAEFAVIPVGTPQYKQAIIPTKARYFRLILANTDASARTMSAWAYLKV